MKKVIEYKICREAYSLVFEKAVLRLLSEGWQPLGGVCFIERHDFEMGNQYVYVQAMVKYADN